MSAKRKGCVECDGTAPLPAEYEDPRDIPVELGDCLCVVHYREALEEKRDGLQEELAEVAADLAALDKVKKPLTPPDLKQCQADHQVGAFTMGGRVGERTRCTNVPTVVLKETKRGADGRMGSMSLCDECLAVARKQLRVEFSITRIKKPKARRKA